MKKVLIVEDFQERIDTIISFLIQHEITVAKNMSDGLELLKTKEFDIVFLDHDIGGSLMTGSDLAKIWYKEWASFKCQKPLIIIHSMNIEKATVMESFLKPVALKVEKIPFKFLNNNSLRKLDLVG